MLGSNAGAFEPATTSTAVQKKINEKLIFLLLHFTPACSPSLLLLQLTFFRQNLSLHLLISTTESQLLNSLKRLPTNKQTKPLH